jgi:hypothetical protein
VALGCAPFYFAEITFEAWVEKPSLKEGKCEYDGATPEDKDEYKAEDFILCILVILPKNYITLGWDNMNRIRPLQKPLTFLQKYANIQTISGTVTARLSKPLI